MPLLLALLLAWLPLPASAEEPPACTPAREGGLRCMAGTLCQCRHQAGGSLTGRPAGLRWDCGVLRPNCGPVAPAAPPPASLWLFGRP